MRLPRSVRAPVCLAALLVASALVVTAPEANAQRPRYGDAREAARSSPDDNGIGGALVVPLLVLGVFVVIFVVHGMQQVGIVSKPSPPPRNASPRAPKPLQPSPVAPARPTVRDPEERAKALAVESRKKIAALADAQDWPEVAVNDYARRAAATAQRALSELEFGNEQKALWLIQVIASAKEEWPWHRDTRGPWEQFWEGRTFDRSVYGYSPSAASAEDKALLLLGRDVEAKFLKAVPDGSLLSFYFKKLFHDHSEERGEVGAG